MMDTNRIEHILFKAAMVAPFTFVAGCVGLAYAVLQDTTFGINVGGVVALLSLAVILVGIVAQLLHRQWWKALGGLGALLASLVIGVLFGVMIGVGQHHPQRPEEVADTTALEFDYEDEEQPTVRVDRHGVAVELFCEVPADDAALAQSVAAYLRKHIFIDDENPETPAFEGDFLAFLEACAERKWEYLERDTYADFPATLPDDADEGLTADDMRAAAEEGAAYSSYSLRCDPVEETDETITWCVSYCLYLYDTAHPSTGEETVTFHRHSAAAPAIRP